MNSSVEKPDLTQLRVRAKELLRAVRGGDPQALARVLPYFGSNPEFKLANAQTVIARESGFDSWPRLVRSFEAPPPKGPSDTELFFVAITKGDEDRAIELLRRSPELAGARQKMDYGWISPLHSAAQHARFRVAKELIESGAELYAVTQGGYPPVDYATDPAMIEYLLQASSDKDNIPPTYGIGIDIVLASRLGFLDRVKMHVAKDPLAIFRRGCIGESVLHWPAHNGFVEIVAYLLDVGALIECDEIGLYGGKPLHWAAEHSANCVRLLLERGANPVSRNLMKGDFEGFTPLHMTASQGVQCVECAELLVAAGADGALLDANGRKPVDVASERGHTRMEAFLRAL